MPHEPTILENRDSHSSTPYRAHVDNVGVSRRWRRVDWRAARRAKQRSELGVLAVAVSAGGAGVLAATAINLLNTPWAAVLSLVALWAGMLAAVVHSATIVRPRGLFAFRFADVIWGLGLAAAIRILTGIMSDANSSTFPTSSPLGRASIREWLVQEVLAAGLLGPVVEELFFRAVLLVVVFRIVRSLAGGVIAGIAAALASSGSFVLLHAAFTPLSFSEACQFLVLGLACSALVLLTGRIWGAVLLHIAFNAAFLILSAIGALLA